MEGALFVRVRLKVCPETQLEVGPVSAKFINVPLLLLPETSGAVVNAVFVPPAKPSFK